MEEVSLAPAVNSASLKSDTQHAAVKVESSSAQNEKAVKEPDVKATKPEPVPTNVAKQVVKKVNDLVKSFSTKISFDIDPESSQSIITVTEKESGKLIRQIPSEEMLELMQKMEEISGIIFHRRV